MPELPKEKKYILTVAQIRELQKEPLNDLLLGNVSQKEYLKIIHEKHGDRDTILDDYISQTIGGRSFEDRFGDVKDVWERHKEVSESISEKYKEFFDNNVRFEKFVKKMDMTSQKNTESMPALKKQRKKHLQQFLYLPQWWEDP